jgi:hypothetical protein
VAGLCWFALVCVGSRWFALVYSSGLSLTAAESTRLKVEFLVVDEGVNSAEDEQMLRRYRTYILAMKIYYIIFQFNS